MTTEVKKKQKQKIYKNEWALSRLEPPDFRRLNLRPMLYQMS